MPAYAFLSYQTEDKAIAGQVKRLLSEAKIDAFLAHEDIEVSMEWREKILEEIGKANIFICLLSKHYFQSPWCAQESGIAASRAEMTVVPLSLDGTSPRGFLSAYQAVNVDPVKINLRDLLPAFLRHDFDTGISLAIELIANSGGYRSAEQNFQTILPHLPNMSAAQKKLLLQRAAINEQVHNAALCASEYLPPILKSHGRFLDLKTRKFLKDVCARYAQ